MQEINGAAPRFLFPFHQHNKKEETMAEENMGAPPPTPEQKLSKLRLGVIDLLKDWGTTPFAKKEKVLHAYLNYLRITTPHHIHKHKRDALADFKVIEDVLALLEPNIAEGQRNYIQFQMAVVYAHKRLGMLLQVVDRKLKEHIIVPDDDFREWIAGVLANEDWEGYLKFAHRFEPIVLHKAKANGVRVEQQTITCVDFDFVNRNDIENHLTMYREEVENAHKMPQDNVDCAAHGPGVCKWFREVMSNLSDIISGMPEDDIKEETSGGVQTNLEADEDAEMAGRDKKRLEWIKGGARGASDTSV